MPKLIEVESSNVAKVGYDKAEKELHVEFKNGSLYRYILVPKTVHEDMMKAESVGKFLNTNIKGNYSYERIR